MSGSDMHAMNVELPSCNQDVQGVAGARSRSNRSESPVAERKDTSFLDDRGRRRTATVKRLFRSPQGRRQPAVDEAWESKSARNPFASPSGAPDDENDVEDVDMGQGDGYLLNAPALPKNPTFKGSTKEERRVFMSAYKVYINQTNALTANGVRPFIMPVSACIEPATKQRVAEWDMGKDPEDVSESEWIAWFKLAYDVDPRALETLKKRLTAAIVFDMSKHIDSRIGRMLDNMSAALRSDRQEWILREESAVVVKIITDAIKPASLYRAVTEQTELTRNKPLKKDVHRFVRWLREYAIGHERYVGYEEDKPAAKSTVKFESAKPSRARGDNVKTYKPASVQLSTQAAGTPVRSTPAAGCLKCKSPDHRVRDCPDVTKDEAVALLKAHANALAVERSRKNPPGRAGLKRVTNSAEAAREDLLCMVEGVLPVHASLLDSGADLSVASGGLVSALIASGAAVEMVNTAPSGETSAAEEPRVQDCLWTADVTGLRVWVDESVRAVGLTLGLPVMKKLGYSDQTLLESARRQQTVWDFGDQPITTPGVAMHRVLRLE
ncbi:hypothetical protein AC1031_009656 [Aphanomyces cochlioides]|nr:hypothetical protein AC1031_009656 [Aphanomyces cochlioides]